MSSAGSRPRSGIAVASVIRPVKAMETTQPGSTESRNAPRAPWRLLVLFVFPFTYMTLDKSIPPLGPSFLILTVANMAACALLLWQLSAPLRRTLWIWFALVLFLDGYFLKMAWFAHKLDNPAYINLYYSEVRWVSRGRILNSYSWVTLGFVTFCLVATAAVRYGGDQKSHRAPSQEPRLIGPTLPLVLGTTLGYLMVMFLQISLNYGVLGVANPSIPFHLGSVITLFQRSLAPGALLLAVWIFDQKRSRLANVTAVVIALFGIADSLITTSRGSLIALTLPVFVLWSLTGKFTRRRKLAAVALLLTATLLYPVLSSLRQEKIDPAGGSQPTTLSFDSVFNSGFILLSRVGAGGIDGVWFAMDASGQLSASRTLGFLRPNKLTVYYTESIVRVPNPNDFRPTGWIGGLMIVGGAAGVVVLGSMLLALIAVVWRRLQRVSTWPVSLSLAAGTIAVFISGGVLDLLLFVRLGIQILACELIYQKLHRVSNRREALTSIRTSTVGLDR